ncbi:hypothetical protein SAMN04488564_103743 [Lentzea waywayandensis]|uniref:Uncharacterized protein n=1 Tax=Lentzea waywayandensis TaxID=84724 RepID=A0A1I6E318_9PSEU|nr:hypothetical protein [Lentzea waywayandensis]SFR12139.1 hypothetical protein SAMN04488564_103743 [Lentzea waywayandensis]
MGKTEIVNVAGVTGEELVLEVASHPFSIRVLEPGNLASIEGVGDDVLDCFLDVRSQLEEHGILLCCMGARPDVWPSGMLRQFSDGRKAYLQREGVRTTEDDVVDIFAPADAADVVTVREQREALRRRFQAMKDRR